MKISYDPETDALYIRLLDGEYQCRTLRLNDEIALNVGPGDALVGIEILDAKEVLGHGRAYEVILEIAQRQDATVSDVIARLVSDLSPASTGADSIVGLFGTEPDLIDRVCEAAMTARERDPIRCA